VTSFSQVGDICGVLEIEKIYNMTLPDWVTDDVYDEMWAVRTLGRSLMYPTKETVRLRGGPLLGKMLSNMLSKPNNTDNDMQLYLYSTHDNTMAALLSTWDHYNGTNPPYASAIIVELHQINEINYVQVLYRTDLEGDPNLVLVPGCTELCPLTDFQQLMRPLIPKDVQLECQLTNVTILFPQIY
jgi:lysosomal acid phosphatase